MVFIAACAGQIAYTNFGSLSQASFQRMLESSV